MRYPSDLTDAEWALVAPLIRPAKRGGQPRSVDVREVLADFAQTLAANTPAVMVLDQAGWHGAKALQIPESITLVPLPPYSPNLNLVEPVWLYLRERYLSHRLLADYDAVVDACCEAWNALTAEAGRLQSLTAYPYLQQVKR